MSFSHAQGLRDTLHRLRDTYAPPTAEEARLFTYALTTEEPVQTEPELVCLQPEMPVPIPVMRPEKPKSIQTKWVAPKRPEKPPSYYYPPEEVETRW